MWVQFLHWEDALEESMATHSSIVAWRNPWTEEPGGLWSLGLRRVGHDWATAQCMTIILNMFICLLAISVCSLEKCPWKSGCLFSYYWVVYIYICLKICFEIFSPIMWPFKFFYVGSLYDFGFLYSEKSLP